MVEEAASAASILQLELQLPLQFLTGPASTTSSSMPAAGSTASIATSAALGGGLTIASVVGVVGGGFLAGTKAHPATTKRRRQLAVAATNDSGVAVGGLSPRKSSIGSLTTTTVASSLAPQFQGSGGGSCAVTGASGSSSGRVRPLGQWSRRWPAGAGESHRTNASISGGGAGSVRGSGNRLTARLEEQSTAGRMSGWQAAPLPFGLVQRPRSSTTMPLAVAAPDLATDDGADKQKERRQSSISTAGPVRRSVDAENAQVQMLPMQLIDVHLELPQWRKPQHRRQFVSVSSSGSASSAGLRPGAAAPAGTGLPARLGRVQLGGQAGPGAADFVGAGAAAARARRMHPMLDARRRRCEELVRATYLTAPGKRTSMTSSLSSSMVSIMQSGGDFSYAICGIEGDDVYSSGLRSRVHSAYFSTTAPVKTPPATPPPPQVDDEEIVENRQPRSSPATLSQCSSAGSQRTLRSPSPDQQPPPNTTESGRMRRHGGQNFQRDVHIAY